MAAEKRASGLAKTWTIERLRRLVVAAAAVLLLAILGFVLYGRWRLRRIAQDLPARLGISIQQTTNGYVLSKTEQGRTVFTLHAARAIEFKSGKRVSLHDVRIDFYNPQGTMDTISGADFEFDPRNQIVESQGETRIVLYPPPSANGMQSKSGGQPIRVTSHGLVFNQKTGIATCSGEVDFQVANSTGHAIGAKYDSKQGRLDLLSQVELTATMQNHPVRLLASRAVYERNASRISLLNPRFFSVLPNGTERAEARSATVDFRADGSAEGVQAQGGVFLASADGTTMRSAAAEAILDQKSQPRQVRFSGGVQFSQKQPDQEITGTSLQAEVGFNGQGRAERATFDRDVRFQQQVNGTTGRLARNLTAAHLELHMRPVGRGQTEVQSAVANGDATFTAQTTSTGRVPQKNTLAAQTLNAEFGAGNRIEHIDGIGQTLIRTVAANGAINTSTGDRLTVDFTARPSIGTAQAAADGTALSAGSIQNAVQTGHVVMEQIVATPLKPNHPSEQKSLAGDPGSGLNGASSIGGNVSTATAARVEFVAANDTFTLTGHPQFRDTQLEMAAERIEVHRATGNAVFTGVVQSTLRSNRQPQSASAGGLLDAGNQPVHIIAQQATLLHGEQKAVFAGRARLWTGENSVAAPVIELSQKMRTLTASSPKPCARCVMGTFLGFPGASIQLASSRSRPNGQPSTFRIFSDRFVYSDAERKLSLLNHVQVFGADSELLADHADIFLAPVTGPAAHMGNVSEKQSSLPRRDNSMQSRLERIVATGHIQLTQPGRRATGTRLVYTADDGRFVLTGSSASPPEVVDVDRGTVTGLALTFTSPGQAIMVSGNSNRAATVHTRVKKN